MRVVEPKTTRQCDESGNERVRKLYPTGSPKYTMRANWINVPNALSALRLVGTPLPVVAAWLQSPTMTLGLVLCLVLTDWLDGVIARAWRQETSAGALLDTLADIVLGVAVLWCAWLLNRQTVWEHRFWIGAVGASYALSATYSLWKFRRWPSYHTLLAKAGMVLVGIAGLALLAAPLGLSARAASICLIAATSVVTIGNLEALLITLRLHGPSSNIRSVFHQH